MAWHALENVRIVYCHWLSLNIVHYSSRRKHPCSLAHDWLALWHGRLDCIQRGRDRAGNRRDVRFRVGNYQRDVLQLSQYGLHLLVTAHRSQKRRAVIMTGNDAVER